MSKLLKATHGSDKTPLILNEIKIPCYVLEDGTRVFSSRGIQRALGSKATSGTWLKRFVNDSPITSYLKTGILESLNNPIKFKRPDAGGAQSMTYGHEVTVLIDICDSIFQVNKTGGDIDKNIVDSAEIILRSVAKVGIIALVDEVTGYQYDRERDELQKILKAYIAEGLLPWQKTFPDIFYKELFRLNGWDFTVRGIKRRPSVVGTWTNKLIYEQLPKGVLEELKEKTPKNVFGKYKARFFQSLTPETGNPHLTGQLNQIVTLFQLSDNMEHMWNQFEKLKSRQSGQLELPFDFDKDGRTIEPEYIEPLPKLSKFNKSLKRGLGYNPKTNKFED